MSNNYLQRTLYNPEIGIHTKYPFYVLTVGSSSEENIHRPFGIEDYLILYTETGCGTAIVDGKECSLNPGSVLLLPPFTPHEYYRQTKAWNTLWVTFNGVGLDMFLNECSSISDWNGDVSFSELHMRIWDSKNTLDFKLCSLELYSLLLELHDILSGGDRHRLQIKNKLGTAVKYISEHYTEDISINQLAQSIGMTDSHFCRLFKEISGMRPVEYITQLRISMAKMLLIGTDKSVCDIGRAVGYKSESYFIMSFKKSSGMTPKEFRIRQKM